jgi:hypothetical protein
MFILTSGEGIKKIGLLLVLYLVIFSTVFKIKKGRKGVKSI